MLTGERWRVGGDLREASTRIGIAGAWVLAVAMALLSLFGYAMIDGFGLDSHAYYLTGQRGDLYGWPDGSSYGYLYSPLFAQVAKPLTALPWPAFRALWICAEAIAYAWLLWPLPAKWRALACLYVVPALCIGNIFGAMGVLLVLSVRRHPGLWAYPLLTKVVPAGVGLVWYLARGQWSSVARVGVVTASVVAVSAASQPQLWIDWFGFLAGHSGHDPWRLAQLPVALALTVYAARTDRPGLLAVAFWLTLAPPLYMQGWGALAPAVRLALPSCPVYESRAVGTAPELLSISNI
jgi:hypothetical protein